MMKTEHCLWVTILYFFFLGGCVKSPSTIPLPPSYKISNSLSQVELEYYNDSFDKMRDELWERAGYINDPEILENFKLADLSIKDGKVKITTGKYFFSKGGLATKYTIRGDFDIQVDCTMNCVDGLSFMDQLVIFLIADKTRDIQNVDSVIIGSGRIGGRSFNTIFSGQTRNGYYYLGSWQKIGNFDGTLRIVRLGKNVSTFFMQKNSGKWNKIYTFESNPNNIIAGFKVQNYSGKRKDISADDVASAVFDNFKINAAQGIVEKDI